jgi:flagellar hook-basal body complex protein FliE
MSTIDAASLMAQMQSLSAQAAGKKMAMPAAAPSMNGAQNPSEPTNGFADLLKQSVNGVNNVQAQAGQMKQSFEQGDPDVSLDRVMVAVQKADISFKAMSQVRTKLVTAYKDIMNTHV